MRTALVVLVIAALLLLLLRRSRQAAESPDSAGTGEEDVFLRCVFGMLAELCKSDGFVSQAEIGSVEQLIKERLKIEADAALSIFRGACRSSRSFQQYAGEFQQAFSNRRELQEMALEILVEVAHADGRLDRAEDEQLVAAAEIFGFKAGEFVDLCRRVRQGSAPAAGGPYAALGCAPGAELKEVKRRYRQLVRQCHPDKLVARGMSPELIERAREKFIVIQEAYEQIRAESGGRPPGER